MDSTLDHVFFTLHFLHFAWSVDTVLEIAPFNAKKRVLCHLAGEKKFQSRKSHTKFSRSPLELPTGEKTVKLTLQANFSGRLSVEI